MQADQILKEFWEDNERFADFFNTVFFGGRKVIGPEELETISADMSDTEETKQGLKGITKYRDKVKLWHGMRLAILGIENQSRIHYAMPERVMLFDALQYEHQRKRIAAVHKRKKDLPGDEEYLSGFAKNDRLAPVLTAVIYYGEKPWNGPVSLWEMVDVPEEMEASFNDYHMHLFQVLGNSGEDFSNADIRTVLRNADALRSGRVQDMDKRMDAELVKYLAAFVNSEKVMELSKGNGGNVAVCTALEEMINAGKAEGKAEGRIEGRAEGKAEYVLELLEELGHVPEGLRKRIMGERDLEVLKRWHKQAIRAGSVEQFAKAL